MAKKKSDKTAKITREDVEHVADLILVKLTEEEIKTFTPQLQSILKTVDVLDEINTENVPETSQVTGLKNVLRKDKVKPSLSQAEALSNAAEQEDGYFKIKGRLSAEADA